MSACKEYTPSMDAVRSRYARIIKTDGTLALAISRQKEFDRAIAAHDRALREQIARDIEAHIDDDGTDEWFAAIELAACIARGEDQTDE